MSEFGTLTFTVAFDRISRNHNVPPLTVTVDDGPVDAVADQIAEAVYEYARPRCISGDIGATVRRPQLADARPLVSTDLDGANGYIRSGWHTAGQFEVALVRDEEVAA